MQKPWRDYEPYEFEPIDLSVLSAGESDYLLSFSIEFIALGFEHVGDYRLHSGWVRQLNRFFRSADGAVLGWVSDRDGQRSFSFGSILGDGTFVQSAPTLPTAPWSCCRFPVFVNFGSGCGLEDLLVMHLKSLVELEHGCGPTICYPAEQLREVVHYMQSIVHETLHGKGAPGTPLPVPQAEAAGELVSS